MSFLTADQITAAEDFATIEVNVPEWAPKGTDPKNAKVLVKSLSGKERDDFEKSIQDRKTGKPDYTNYRARLCALVLVNEDGQRLFVGRRDEAILGTKSVKALQRVFNAATELNGISDDDIEEMTEDFGEEASEASTSG